MAQAKGAILFILSGIKGSGMSCNAPLFMQLNIPALLRATADEIERSLPADLKQQLYAEWPRDEHGRLICAPDHPMPPVSAQPSIGLRWAHVNAYEDGDSDDVAYYRCKDCAAAWSAELPQ